LHQDHVRNGDVLLTRADPGRAGEVLGWQPRVDLHSGLRAHMQALASPVPDYSRAA
ncbi:epimerase, partial [Streptomyces sp. SID6648]|nr:epimerase [Streptomyces sp. SID6648]